MTLKKLLEFYSTKKWEAAVAAYFLAVALLILRFDFGFHGFPKGTNTLDTYLTFFYAKKYGFFPWFPLTDWGQPFPGFTGPTILYPFELILPISFLIRTTEFVSLFVSGFSSFIVLKRITSSKCSAFIASNYYLLMGETSQFFDGHLNFMVTVAITPLFIYSFDRLLRKPSAKWSISVSFLFYLLFSIGDIGGFYMIFIASIPVFLFLLIQRLGEKMYSVKEVLLIFSSAAIFFVLSLSWLMPFISGARPEYTTNITTHVIPFAKASGTSILYSFTGFISDNSYTYFYLHNFTYSILPASFYFVYASIPLFILYYVATHRTLKFSLVAFYSLIFALLATGNTLPLVSVGIGAVYNHVPLFDYIPAIFRWDYFTVLGYTYLLSYAARDLIFTFNRDDLSDKDGKSTSAVTNLRPEAARKHHIRRYTVVKLFVTFVIVFVLASQNFEVFSVPPTTFEFPNDHTAAYTFLHNFSSEYNLIEFPFGSTGSRTPWGGVSQSSEMMSPVFSGKDTIMFQAGTPYSLAMDEFVGYGETYGMTNNISKFLANTNTRYVVITNYHNWSHASDPVIDPINSNDGIYRQNGLGYPALQTANQTVYILSNTTGPLYYTNDYYVYFGGTSLLYDIIDAPFYEPGVVLVNGSAVGSGVGALIEHSKGIIIQSECLSSCAKYVQLASASAIPVLAFIQPSAMTGASNSLSSVQNLWNASNGVSFETLSQGSNLVYILNAPLSISNLYVRLNYLSRVEIPTFSSVNMMIGNKIYSYSNTPKVNIIREVNFSVLKNVTAGISNQNKYPYTGTVKAYSSYNTSGLIWNFTPNNSTFQGLTFPALNFSQHSGISFRMNVTIPVLMTGSLLYENSYWETSLSQTINISGGYSTFYVNYGSFRPTSKTQNYYDYPPYFVIGLANSGNLSSLNLYNFTIYDSNYSSTNGFRWAPLNYTSDAGVKEVRLILTGNSSINYSYLELSSNNTGQELYHFSLNFSSLELIKSLLPSFDSFGILLFAQTYNPFWSLEYGGAISVSHFPVDIGLNGWFVSPHNKSLVISIVYLPNVILKSSLIFEIILLPITLFIVYVVDIGFRKFRRQILNMIFGGTL